MTFKKEKIIKMYQLTFLKAALESNKTKNRNETGLNLSLGTRLMVMSKRLGRNRCCDTTPECCLKVCRLITFDSHC